MRVVFDDIGNLHRNDVQFGIALAVARLNASEAMPLHVHALASGNVCRRYEVQPSVFGGKFYREDAPLAEAVGAYVEICEHSARIHSFFSVFHILCECFVEWWMSEDGRLAGIGNNERLSHKSLVGIAPCK